MYLEEMLEMKKALTKCSCNETSRCYTCSLEDECKEALRISKLKSSFWPFTSQKAKDLFESIGKAS